MKSALIALALLAAPAAAHAQVAAATMPNTFDGPARGAPAQAVQPAAPVVAATPANPQSEATVRKIIADAQAGTMDYSIMTDSLAERIRPQAAQVTPIIQSLGAIQTFEFAGSQEGADMFLVRFANAATQWIIGFDDAGKVDALLFRPAE
ncbi:MAG: hypothetical protein ACT6SD_00100 [Brevundimonas sp.]|jgi:hypothetical protein|uniref:hypothetical protein n=1 Tax=Brevundimonas sp. TaxID=1871086 RepID=UPI00403355CD